MTVNNPDAESENPNHQPAEDGKRHHKLIQLSAHHCVHLDDAAAAALQPHDAGQHPAP